MSEFAFIFDLDGTLVDSRIQIQVSLDTTRVNSGLPASPEGFVEEHLGLPVESLFSDLKLEPSELHLLIQTFRENLLFEIENGNPIFDGVLSFMQQSKNTSPET